MHAGCGWARLHHCPLVIATPRSADIWHATLSNPTNMLAAYNEAAGAAVGKQSWPLDKYTGNHVSTGFRHANVVAAAAIRGYFRV